MSSNPHVPSPLETDILELRAEEQRRRLHNSVAALRTQVREKLDVRKNAREHVWSAAGTVGVVGLVLGYGMAGIFTKH